MAEVYVATDPAGKQVAIRRLMPRYGWHLFRRRQFMRGLRIQEKLAHPNIVRVYETVGGWAPYAVMEYVEGVNLRHAMNRGDQFVSKDMIEQAVQLLDMILNALHHIHQSGYMHLDLKPENILLNHNGEVKLLDFDLARAIPSEPKYLPALEGTPNYVSPEQFLREPTDQRADLFALGVTAYELFTGQKPVQARNAAEVRRAYTDFNVRFPSPEKYNSALPQPFVQIIMKCIEKKADSRYPSTAMILKDVRAAKRTLGWE